MTNRRLSIALLALTTPSLVAAGGDAVPRAGKQIRPATDAVVVKGLDQPAEMLIDKWGVPHIYARTTRDALFLQGWNAARDRLWQIDLWRKRGLGLLARDFGPSYAAKDRAARLLLYRGDMGREWAAYGPDAKSFADAFTQGINSYVQEIREGTRKLPREFEIAGTRPDLWSAADVVRIRSHGLVGNVEDEVRRARTMCRAGAAADAYRSRLEPAWKPHLPKGLDLCGIPEDVLRDYSLGTSGVSFDPLRMRGAQANLKSDTALVDRRVDVIGSNNWVIGGSRTASGRPILANDPHRSHGAPSLRYIVHLNAPGMSVIGAGEPMLPGVSIGHNGSIAFGLTIFAIDQEDLYEYRLVPGDPSRYEYGGASERFREVSETIEVKGEAPRVVRLQFTRHGPVLKVDQRSGRAWALRSVWSEPGTAAYFGSASYMRARNWQEFRATIERWGAPGENQVYADTKGNIGWISGGLTPRRTTFDGLLPVPGDGRYEWQGFLRGDELPSSFNPAQGWFATANQMNLPADYPINERRIGFEWADPSRYQRISEVLAAGKAHTIEGSVALQSDLTSPLDRRFAALVKASKLQGRGALEERAISLVANWDGRATTDSVAATIATVWLNRHLGMATTRALYPSAAEAIGRPTTGSLLDLLSAPDARFGENPVAGRDAILMSSLGGAMREIAGRLGGDMERWQYGRFYTASFTHPLAQLASPAEARVMTVGPYPMHGSWSSPIASSFGANSRLIASASFRMVLDVGHWDSSRAINAPGQSGEPASSHFGDLARAWLAGETFPLLYSREAVLAQTQTRLALTPAARSRPMAKETDR